MDACFGKAEVLDLARLNQVLHRSSYVFDRHVRVNTMLIEQLDCLDLEPLERALDGLLDMLWPTVEARRTLHAARIEIRTEVEPEFGGDHHLLAEGSLVCLQQNEPSVDLDSISFARASRSRSSITGVITLRASLPATNTFGVFCIAAILTSASPSFAGSPGCLP